MGVGKFLFGKQGKLGEEECPGQAFVCTRVSVRGVGLTITKVHSEDLTNGSWSKSSGCSSALGFN